MHTLGPYTTAEKNAVKGRKPIVKLSWELLTPFSDFMRALPTQQNRNEEEDEEDDDELQAHQDSMQRLRVSVGSADSFDVAGAGLTLRRMQTRSRKR